MKNIFFTCITWVFVVMAVNGQNSIKGTVVDTENRTIPGVNIYIPELSNGTISENDGFFFIKGLPQGTFKVRFSFVGYKTVIKDINTGVKRLYIIQLKPSVLQSEEVVVSSGSYSSQHENAIKIESYHLHDGITPSKTNVIEALSKVPGVSIITKSPGISTPVIRGLSTNNILVLNNGVKLENYQFSQDHPYLISEQGFRDVEIIKGPASLLYGSDALGGVLNFIKDDPAPSGQVKGAVEAGWNSNTNGYHSGFNLKGSREMLNWGLNGSYKNHADYNDGNNRAVLNSRFNATNTGAFVGTGYKNNRFKLYYDYNALQAGMPVEQAISQISNPGRKPNIWNQNLQHHLATLKHNVYFNQWKLNNTISQQVNHRKLFGSSENMVDMQLSTTSWNGRLSRNLTSGNQIITSVQSRYQQNRNFNAPNRILPDYSLFDIAGLGLYQLNVNQKLFMQLGMRYDYRHINAPEQEKASHSHEEEQVEEEHHEHMKELIRSYNNLSASAGMTWELIPHGLLRFNLATAYRTPHVSELLQDGEHGTRYEIGDRNLESQRNYEADLSFHYHNGIVVMELAGFYNSIRNYIYLAPTGETTEENFPVYQYSQANALLTGFEGSVDLHPTKFMMLSTTLSYLYTLKENGDYLPFIPQNRLTPSITLLHPNCRIADKLTIKLDVPVVFEQDHPAQFESATNAYTLVNLSAAIEKGRFNLSVHANNMLNATYLDHLSTLKPLSFYNQGRNIGVNLRYSF